MKLADVGLKELGFQSADAGMLLFEPAIARMGLCIKSYE